MSSELVSNPRLPRNKVGPAGFRWRERILRAVRFSEGAAASVGPAPEPFAEEWEAVAFGCGRSSAEGSRVAMTDLTDPFGTFESVAADVEAAGRPVKSEESLIKSLRPSRCCSERPTAIWTSAALGKSR